MNKENKVAVITGGASGMGKACWELLTKQGIKVAIWDKQTVTNLPLTSLSVSCNVSSETEVEQALEKTIQRLGVPQICINCAGIAPAKRLISRESAMPLKNFTDVLEVNLIGTVNVMRVVAFAMSQLPLDSADQERGVIINTASVAAFEGQIGQIAYSASKGGIVALTLPAARELASHAIRVNTIAPGLIATPLLLGMPQEVQARLFNEVTYPKRLGYPQEFAALALHIIENSYLNGEVIRLDGGLRMSAK